MAGSKFLLNLQFCDLDGIEGSALANLITAAPQGNAAIMDQVGSDTAHEHQILIGSFQRHGVALIG